MTRVLYDALGYAYWAAIIGGVLWWIWSMRRHDRPPARTSREQAELAGLRAATELADGEPAVPPVP